MKYTKTSMPVTKDISWNKNIYLEKFMKRKYKFF